MGKNPRKNDGFDLQTLDVLLDSISESATRPGVQRRDFYQETAKKLRAGTDSTASIIWVSDGEESIRIVGQSGWKSLGEKNQQKLQAYAKQILTSRAKGERDKHAKPSNIYSSVCQPANGFIFLYTLVRSNGDGDLLGQVFHDLVAEVTAQIEIYENARKAQTSDESTRDISHLAKLVQNAGKSTSHKQLAFDLVNDLAKLTKANRVTYLDNAGHIRAISGAASISPRTSTVRNLCRLGKLGLSTRKPLDWQGEEINFEGRRIPRNARRLVESTGSNLGYVIPCVSQGKIYGTVIFEFFEDVSHTVEQRHLISEVIDFASPVIARSSQYNSIPAIRLQNVLFNRLLTKPVRMMALLLAAAGCCFLAWYALFAIERPFQIYGEGTLEPVRKQHVFARTDGEIESLLIDENEKVVPGQKLLQIESRMLEKEMIKLDGEIAEVQQQLRNYSLVEVDEEAEDVLAEEARRAAEVERLKIRLEGLKSRVAFFEERQTKLNIVAPLEGVVVTPDLRRRLSDRPINRGDLLMTIAQTEGEWQIELKIADNRIEFVENSIAEQKPEPLQVEFRLLSDASKTWIGELEKLNYRSDLTQRDEESFVTATVSIPEEELEDSLRMGTRVLGKIECGKRDNFFLLSYEIRNRIHEWFFW